MDDPIQEITPVIHLLTQGTPNQQADAINTYFTPNASFTHPFCRTGSFTGSRALIHSIFQWYKIMSPTIDIQVNSVAFDETNLILYVNISQTFAVWFIPFHRSPVTLTTVLNLTRTSTSSNATSPGPYKYQITSQNDLYQVDQFVNFFAPWGIGRAVVLLWHFFATLCCVVLAYIGLPFTRYMQWTTEQDESTPARSRRRQIVNGSRRAEEQAEAHPRGVNGVSGASVNGIPRDNKFDVLESTKEA